MWLAKKQASIKTAALPPDVVDLTATCSSKAVLQTANAIASDSGCETNMQSNVILSDMETSGKVSKDENSKVVIDLTRKDNAAALQQTANAAAVARSSISSKTSKKQTQAGRFSSASSTKSASLAQKALCLFDLQNVADSNPEEVQKFFAKNCLHFKSINFKSMGEKTGLALVNFVKTKSQKLTTNKYTGDNVVHYLLPGVGPACFQAERRGGELRPNCFNCGKVWPKKNGARGKNKDQVYKCACGNRFTIQDAMNAIAKLGLFDHESLRRLSQKKINLKIKMLPKSPSRSFRRGSSINSSSSAGKKGKRKHSQVAYVGRPLKRSKNNLLQTKLNDVMLAILLRIKENHGHDIAQCLKRDKNSTSLCQAGAPKSLEKIEMRLRTEGYFESLQPHSNISEMNSSDYVAGVEAFQRDLQELIKYCVEMNGNVTGRRRLKWALPSLSAMFLNCYSIAKIGLPHACAEKLSVEGITKGSTVRVLFDRGKCVEKVYSGEVKEICEKIHIVYEDGDERHYTVERLIRLVNEVKDWERIRDLVLGRAKQAGLNIGSKIQIIEYENSPREKVAQAQIVSVGEKLIIEFANGRRSRESVSELRSLMKDAKRYATDVQNTKKNALLSGFKVSDQMHILLHGRVCKCQIVAINRKIYCRVRAHARIMPFEVSLLTKMRDAANRSGSVDSSHENDEDNEDELPRYIESCAEVSENDLPDDLEIAFQTIKSSKKKIYNLDEEGHKKILLKAQASCLNSVNIDTKQEWLFHGASYEAAQLIMKNGYQNAGTKNGKVFGEGVYFARNISYTLQSQYSQPDSEGRRVVLVNRVIVGKRQRTDRNSKMLRPGCRSGGDHTGSVIMKPYANLADVQSMYAFVFFD